MWKGLVSVTESSIAANRVDKRRGWDVTVAIRK